MLRKSFGFAVAAVMVALALETTSSAAIMGVATLVKEPAATPFGAPDAALGAPWVSYKLSLTASGADQIQAVVANISGQLHQRWTSSNVDGVYDTATGNSTNATNGDSHFMAITAGSAMLFANGPNEDNPATGSPLSPSNNDSTGYGVGTSMSATFGPAGAALTAIDVAYIVVPKDSTPNLNILVNVFNPGGDMIGSLNAASFGFGEVPGLPVVGDLALTQTTLGEVVAGNVPVTDVTTLTLDAAAAPIFTPLLAGKPLILNTPPTINNAGAFSWNTAGALRGTYEWALTGVNGANSDAGKVVVTVTAVPEPGTLALFGLAFAGVVGIARRRS